jgi:3-oxoacyl-[acyl-carrier protein] reductase
MNSNKTALITGASRGIGRAPARALADAGTRVIIHYGHSAGEADSLLKEIRATVDRAVLSARFFPVSLMIAWKLSR